MENYINSLFSINHALQNGFKSILDKYKVSNSNFVGYLHYFLLSLSPQKQKDCNGRAGPLRGRREGRPPPPTPLKLYTKRGGQLDGSTRVLFIWMKVLF